MFNEKLRRSSLEQRVCVSGRSEGTGGRSKELHVNANHDILLYTSVYQLSTTSYGLQIAEHGSQIHQGYIMDGNITSAINSTAKDEKGPYISNSLDAENVSGKDLTFPRLDVKLLAAENKKDEKGPFLMSSIDTKALPGEELTASGPEVKQPHGAHLKEEVKDPSAMDSVHINVVSDEESDPGSPVLAEPVSSNPGIHTDNNIGSVCTEDLNLKDNVNTDNSHNGDTLYGCFMSDKKFSDEKSMIKNIHIDTGKKLHKCVDCLKQLPTKTLYFTYLHIPNEKSPYRCTVCRNWFSDQGTIMKHLHVHTRETPFICSSCAKKYTHGELYTYILSLNAEGKYSCSVCKKQVSSKGNLSNHLRVHTKEKPFKCTICDKRFQTKRSLSNHRRSRHNKEKPYRCTVCQDQFSTKDRVLRHLRVHIGDSVTGVTLVKLPYAQESRKQDPVTL